jgi:hypothetical protein
MADVNMEAQEPATEGTGEVDTSKDRTESFGHSEAEYMALLAEKSNGGASAMIKSAGKNMVKTTLLGGRKTKPLQVKTVSISHEESDPREETKELLGGVMDETDILREKGRSRAPSTRVSRSASRHQCEPVEDMVVPEKASKDDLMEYSKNAVLSTVSERNITIEVIIDAELDFDMRNPLHSTAWRKQFFSLPANDQAEILQARFDQLFEEYMVMTEEYRISTEKLRDDADDDVADLEVLSCYFTHSTTHKCIRFWA